jgi:hypothetical protein
MIAILTFTSFPRAARSLSYMSIFKRVIPAVIAGPVKVRSESRAHGYKTVYWHFASIKHLQAAKLPSMTLDSLRD